MQKKATVKKGNRESVCKSAETASVLKNFKRSQQGRPRIKVDQPELLSTIIKIVQNSSAINDCRRTECVRSISTLDDIHIDLMKVGRNLSRNGLYLRFLRRGGNTSEGKRYKNTAPNKFLRPESFLIKKI